MATPLFGPQRLSGALSGARRLRYRVAGKTPMLRSATALTGPAPGHRIMKRPESRPFLGTTTDKDAAFPPG
jgi:hypothetical protein